MSKVSCKIAAFYRFCDLEALGDLRELRQRVRAEMRERKILGTVILASEGFNATVCGFPDDLDRFLEELSSIFATPIKAKFSFCDVQPFRKVDVKVKPEIVTLKKPVDRSLAEGTHVSAEDWNRLIADPEVMVLDTRNDYEFRTGTFERAINPSTEKFSDLPEFVAQNLDPDKYPKVAMFCTGGIRCEKFAPYMKGLGFREVYQLEGGILKYLERVPKDEQLWRGECFVFDSRVSVNERLEPGVSEDLSQEGK